MALNEAPAPVERAPKPLPMMQRQDAWWVQPLMVFAVFAAFIVYASWRTFENAHYEFGPYLSPFYSPKLSTTWMVFGKHVSPALFILPIPLFFRGTCYYYRKAYYRAFFWDPAACAVKEVSTRKNYTGEREFPLYLQNLHRYAFYLAAIILVVLWWDALLAFNFNGRFGMGVGSLIFLGNVVLLSFYTFSCHSWRHLSGGCVNCFSCSSGTKARYGLWQRVSHWNENHPLWAWLSLFSVVITDLYVRALATGAIHDVRFF